MWIREVWLTDLRDLLSSVPNCTHIIPCTWLQNFSVLIKKQVSYNQNAYVSNHVQRDWRDTRGNSDDIYKVAKGHVVLTKTTRTLSSIENQLQNAFWIWNDLHIPFCKFVNLMDSITWKYLCIPISTFNTSQPHLFTTKCQGESERQCGVKKLWAELHKAVRNQQMILTVLPTVSMILGKYNRACTWPYRHRNVRWLVSHVQRVIQGQQCMWKTVLSWTKSVNLQYFCKIPWPALNGTVKSQNNRY